MVLTALVVSVGIGACALAEGPARPPAVPIAGTVVDAERRPTGGVDVVFSHLEGACVVGGEVVARAETDAQGRFRLEVPGASGGGPEPGVLWAYRPGSLVASYRVNRETLPPDWPVAMVLDHPARAEFLVRGPDGRPVAGARVHPRGLRGEPYSVPAGLSDQIADRTVTDARGRAVLTAFFPEEVSTVFVSAPGLGRQYFALGNQGGVREARTIDLVPVGRVEGRIVADDPALARHRKLMAVTWAGRRGPPAIGLERPMTDDQGRFTIPEAPVGDLTASANPPAGSPAFFQMTSPAKVEAGRTTQVELRPLRTVRLRGTLRERGTGAPIAGAGVNLYGSSHDETGTVRTDPNGRFTLFSLPGGSPLIMVEPPDGFAHRMFGLDSPRIPGDVAAFDLPPIELSRAGTVAGVVVDDRGAPVPGAVVRASYPVEEGPNARGMQERRAVAGPRGEFQLGGVVAGAPVELSAVVPDGRRTARAIASKAGAAPARLVVEPSDAVSLAGRVVDAAGHRIAGARVHLRVQERYAGGQVKGDALVEIRGAYVLRTNDTGWFRTPPILDPDGEYAALAEADGFEPARTGWTPGKSRTFPELVLRPRAEQGFAAVEGSAADRAGRPVAGAAVWIASDPGQEIRATTDALGRFRLEGVPPTRAFLFVEADGFRFSGRAIDPGAGSVAVALTRSDERPTATMTTLPPPLAGDEMRALARRVFRSPAERILKEGRPGFRSLMLMSLARIDPAWTLEIIENDVAVVAVDGPIRLECARALWERDRDGAIAVVDASTGARWRASGLLTVSRWLPDSERRVGLELLARALVLAQAVANAEEKVRLIGEIAERYLDLGETAKGTEVLRAALPAARALPDAQAGLAARRAFGEVLERVAPADAADLVRGHRVWLNRNALGERLPRAARLAGRDPARLEASLASVLDPRWLPTLCLAMARKDPDRARRVADHRLGEGNQAPFARPYAIGMIAMALADTDKPRATRYLHEAFAALKPLAAGRRRGGLDAQDAATVAAAMLPVAERIDPALVPEFFWRAVSFRGPSRPRQDFVARPEAVLAMLLARYDREVAMMVLDPLLHREPDPQDRIVSDVAQALAAIDPARAVAFVEALPEDPGVGMNPMKFVNYNARLDLATFFADPPARRWERLVSRHLDLYIAGDEDAP